MKSPSSLGPALRGCALLMLLCGCESVKSQAAGPEQPVLQQPASAEGGPARQAASPWQRARSGDTVRYAFHAERQAPGATSPTRLSGRVTLEVVAVRLPWVWVRLGFSDEAGQPLRHPFLPPRLTVPLRAEGTPGLEAPPPEGTRTAESLTAAGRGWEALRYVHDMRPLDGPLRERVVAVEPGPLYLANGVLALKETLPGFRTQGELRLELLEAREGPRSAPAAADVTLDRPLGPGTWYDRRIESAQGVEVERTCLDGEQGLYVRRTLRPAPATGAPCPAAPSDEALATPLEELLLEMLSRAASGETGVPSGQPAPSPLSGQGARVPTLVTEEKVPQDSGHLRVRTYAAAEPWHPALDGLAYEARFNPLAVHVDRVTAAGQTSLEQRSEVTGWGAWVDAPAR